MLENFKIRIARPCSSIAAVKDFYCRVLQFQVIGHFKDHEGFDGVMLGHPGQPYHLEFTIHKDHPQRPAPTPEDLLVFYIPETARFQQIVKQIESQNVKPVKSLNPYWDIKGRTYEGPDGYRFIIYNGEWK